MRALALILAAILTASPADAAPVVGAITAIVGAISSFAASGAIGAFIVRTAISVGLSALAKAIRGKPAAARPAGIVTEVTTSGGTTPQKFILGRTATAGQLIAPPMSYGQNFDATGARPRAYLVYVIAISAVPGVYLDRVIVDDAYLPLSSPAGASWGWNAAGPLAGHAWIDFRDGTQTAAHPDLVAALGADPDRPWQSDMVGPGTAYVVCRWLYNRELYNGLPSVRFEVLGIPLYDPRADSSVGGSGAQRWDTPSTWVASTNPAVMIYNILRGIRMPDGTVWGGEATSEDLPFANWVAAMNECDLVVPAQGGGTEAQYRAGIEVAIDTAPADVIEELLKACAGQLVEIGGIWKIRCGAPGVPVLTISDDDVIASAPEDFIPFPGLSETYNGITATYPEPLSLYESKEAPPRYSTTWEAEDGGRRLVAALALTACPYPGQVQRLMAQGIADHRRFRSHRLTLPPEAAVLEPLDTIAWTSARNGYTSKIFEVTALADDLGSMTQMLGLRERDSGDYAWSGGAYLASPVAAPGLTRPIAQSVPGWAVAATSVTDGTSARRPAIQLTWDASAAIDALGIVWEMRLAGGSVVTTGSYGSIHSGQLTLAEALLAATSYEIRAKLIVDRPTSWTAWTLVTTPDVRLGLIDLNGSRRQLVMIGPLTVPAAQNYAHGGLGMGQMPFGGIWKRGFVFQARRTSSAAWILILRARRRDGGVWGDYFTLDSWEISSPNWAMFADSGTLAGAWEDYEYQVVTSAGATHGAALTNIALTLINVAE